MAEYDFAIHGVKLRLSSGVARFDPVIDHLVFDMSAERDGSGTEPSAYLHLCDRIPSVQKRVAWPLFAFCNSKVRVYGWGGHRICVYRNGTEAETRLVDGARHFWISGITVESVHECAYKIINSVVGEALDGLGRHRVHALAFQLGGQRVLLVAASGVGKSTLAYRLLQHNPAMQLFSDECPLLQADTVHPFPIRLAISPRAFQNAQVDPRKAKMKCPHSLKMLFAFPKDKIGESGPVDTLLIGIAVAGPPRIRRASRMRAARALVSGLVVGVGLIQMAEWMLRVNALSRLLRIFFSRLLTGLRVVWNVKAVYVFEMGPRAAENELCMATINREWKGGRPRADYLNNGQIFAE